MDNVNRLDWSLLEAFLTVAETGSLSAAARRLRASQPTLGRQIKALEAQLGAEVFHRQPKGLEVTELGARLIAPVRAMREASNQVTLAAAGQQTGMRGTVRITASMATAVAHLPAIIAQIRAAEPEISIELVPSNDTSNLLYREADIALRMYRPTQLDLVTRHLGDLELGVYAAHSYLDRRGLPTAETLMDHDFVGFDAETGIIDGFRQGGITVTRDFFTVRCDDNPAYWALVRAGCGIGFGQVAMGDQAPEVLRLDLGLPLPRLPVWLTAHESMRQTPRIRRVWDMLADGMAPLLIRSSAPT